MSEIRYEVVRSAPVEAIVALYEAGGWWRESPRARELVPALVAGSFCFVVARDASGRIVGMARAISDGVSDAYVQDVVVLPSERGRGIGRELVARVVGFCRERGLEWIGLLAEPGTEPFYRGLGFRELEGYRGMRHG